MTNLAELATEARVRIAAGEDPTRLVHIVWFGEAVPLIEDAAAWIEQADVVLVIGTSLKVYPAAGLLHYAPAHARIWLIDPHPAATLPGVQVIAERASIGVAQVVQQLLQEA